MTPCDPDAGELAAVIGEYCCGLVVGGVDDALAGYTILNHD
jgi:2-keto-4-pentenoate hydratase/2-oxohepta-3-ene-1,7-dioic acid hydratase in catechol pathway